MFLLASLAMALQLSLDASPQTRPITILLGPEIEAADEPKQAKEERSAS